jgi:glyoxylase-like metal-dependent hydrolase (beta-lactamase superfamily II)
MFEEILPDLYKIEIPLPKSPLKTLNSYLVKGEGRFLIIDTGMNHERCLHTMLTDLKKIGVDLNRTDFFITHLHADHLGLVAHLGTESSKVYFNEVEASIANSVIRNPEERVQKLASLYLAHGFPKNEFSR